MAQKEQELTKHIQHKNWTPAFNLLVDIYTERLYWHLRTLVLVHDDADDLLQNTFIKVWKALPKYRGEAQIYTWLYRIATNEALAHLKKQKRQASLKGQGAERALGNLEADAYYNGDAMERKLMAALSVLPEKQQAVFKLKYFQEMKYEEMSEVLETSVGALKASYHHATQKIKKYLGSH